MNTRALRRYIDDLLRGRRPKPFRPDDFEAAQIRTAIELRAARHDSPAVDAPRREFRTELHRRLAEQMSDAPADVTPEHHNTRRQVIVATSAAVGAAAAAAVTAVSIDRAVLARQSATPSAADSATGAHTQHRKLAAGRRELGRAGRAHASV